MKLIKKYKSINYNNRASKKINFIIIHYTALNNSREAIEYLCNLKNKVSCHYLISKSGKVYKMVSDNNRAWHAGKSQWKNYKDLNSNSIGVELDFNPKKDRTYNVNIIKILVILIKNLRNKYNIPVANILGHSDIAPYRKIDPGKDFPWDLLEKNKVIKKIIVRKNSRLIIKSLNKWFYKNSFNSKKKKILFMLNYIGYDTSLALEKNKYFNQLLMAYSLRHQFYKNHNYNKTDFINVIISHFINIILTKLKK